jgi:hypothetical protein
MKKPQPEKKTYKIKLVLQENKTAEFTYSDKIMAEAHWLQIKAHLVVGNNAVKSSEFTEE